MMSKLSIHHIGGRGGSRSFPVLPVFENDIVNVLYDADQDCLDQVEAYNRKLQSDLHVLPHCLAEKSGPVTLNINYDPYTSSLLKPKNMRVAGRRVSLGKTNFRAKVAKMP